MQPGVRVALAVTLGLVGPRGRAKASKELLKAYDDLGINQKEQKEKQKSSYFPPILTLDELIDQLQKIRNDAGTGNIGVSACISHKDGIGWYYEHVINAHYANGIVNIPVTLNYQTEQSRHNKK